MDLTSGKYIVFKDGTVEMFPVRQIHVLVANGRPVSSAGFFSISIDGNVKCYGGSDSLGISSHPDDTEIVREMLDEF